MALDPLQCPQCSAPVPLVAGAEGTCPSCGSRYPIPETYQALRDEAAANARKPEAQALAKALGKPPPMVVRGFAMFSSPLFVMFGLGFWIAAGILVGARGIPWIGRHVFHVNTYDVLSGSRQMQLMMLLPIGTLVVGLTLSSWARKRGIVRGGLQAALAATPPTRPGGPMVCHRCAAPLAPESGALTARCAYCQADNLVEMPQAWVVRMRAQAKSLTTEIEGAAQAWSNEKRALHRGLIKRLILWTALLLLPLWFIFGAAGGGSEILSDLGSIDAAGPPVHLPSWRGEMAQRVVEIFACDQPNDGYRDQPTCARGRCTIDTLVPLRHGEVVRHQSSDMPSGSVVDLQMHEQQWLDDAWVTVASAPFSAGHDALTRAPYSGWYRMRVTVPGEDHTVRWYCTTVKR
jgi:LSD1 subclass zinc finger protein